MSLVADSPSAEKPTWPNYVTAVVLFSSAMLLWWMPWILAPVPEEQQVTTVAQREALDHVFDQFEASVWKQGLLNLTHYNLRTIFVSLAGSLAAVLAVAMLAGRGHWTVRSSLVPSLALGLPVLTLTLEEGIFSLTGVRVFPGFATPEGTDYWMTIGWPVVWQFILVGLLVLIGKFWAPRLRFGPGERTAAEQSWRVTMADLFLVTLGVAILCFVMLQISRGESAGSSWWDLLWRTDVHGLGQLPTRALVAIVVAYGLFAAASPEPIGWVAAGMFLAWVLEWIIPELQATLRSGPWETTPPHFPLLAPYLFAVVLMSAFRSIGWYDSEPASG